MEAGTSGPCTWRSNAPWVMVTWDPSPRLPMDRQIRMKTLDYRNFVGGGRGGGGKTRKENRKD